MAPLFSAAVADHHQPVETEALPHLLHLATRCAWSHSVFQPMAAEDVVTAVADAALAAPVKGTVEIGGPDKFHIDEIVELKGCGVRDIC
jgi:uncharacterized protein YbjT (DUF2867 family)